MSDLLRLTTVQSTLHWEQIAANLAQFDQQLSGLEGKTDLVVLPEMFTTGFSMNAAALAESMEGPTVDWLRKKARAIGAVVTGSFIAKEDHRYYNRLVWMQPDGQYQYYDKKHLFTLADEHLTYTAGQKRLLVEWKGWTICPLICYDLRFPVWSRNTEDYDLLIYIANFPERRNHAWKSLLIARAIENQVFTVGVNRVGRDGKDISYSGDTALIDYLGNIRYQISQQNALATHHLSRQELRDARDRFRFLADRDPFNLPGIG
ncbi:MAG: amidohydrolase [Bacteroidota bacterium]